MVRTVSNMDVHLRRAWQAQVQAAIMGNPIEMSYEQRFTHSNLLANAEYFRMMARRSRKV